MTRTTATLGPWPEPDDDAPPPGGVAPVIGAEWPGLDGRSDAPGSRGVALVVAGLQLVITLILPVVLVVAIYASLTVYAIVKAVSGGSDAADPATVLIGVVALVTLVVVALGVGTWAIGRAFDPKKRRS